MYRAFLDVRRCAALAATAATLILLPSLALTEPQAPSGEEIDDANFGKSFVGKVYDGELEIEDWNDLGGGLVSPPIYIHQYQRDNGTISRSMHAGSGSRAASGVHARGPAPACGRRSLQGRAG